MLLVGYVPKSGEPDAKFGSRFFLKWCLLLLLLDVDLPDRSICHGYVTQLLISLHTSDKSVHPTSVVFPYSPGTLVQSGTNQGIEPRSLDNLCCLSGLLLMRPFGDFAACGAKGIPRIDVQLCAVCHAHQGVALCKRVQPSRTQGLIRTTMRAAVRLPPPLLHWQANPSSTTRATPSARCSTKRLPKTSRPGTNLTAQASSTARATTTPQGFMSAKRFANIRHAASSPTAFPASIVMTLGTTTSSPITARAGVSAPRAIHGAWWRRPWHLTDHVFPRLPVRHWVLSVSKRLRYFMQRDWAVLGKVLRIFLSVIAQPLWNFSCWRSETALKRHFCAVSDRR
jgi:hypothetical protein